MQPPLLPSQYPSIDVGTHIALLTYRGLSDICHFLHLVISTAAMGGDSSQTDLVLLPQYSDRLLLGWYSFPECWMQVCFHWHSVLLVLELKQQYWRAPHGALFC